MGMTPGIIIETVASWLDGPELAECVFHHKVDDGGSGTQEEELHAMAQEVESLLETLTETCMTTTTAFVGTQSRVLPPGLGHGYTRSTFSAQLGEVTGECVGAQECALVAKYTAETTRQGRGRMCIPFVPESFINSGKITVAARTIYETAFRPLLSDKLESGGGASAWAGVYSRTSTQFFTMTFAELRPVTTTQRKRVNRKQPFAA